MEGGEREDRMWHYSRITTDTLYSSQGLLRVLHCTAAPSVTVMPVDRGLLEVEDQTEAPSTNESRAASITQAPCQSLLAHLLLNTLLARPSLALLWYCEEGQGA